MIRPARPSKAVCDAGARIRTCAATLRQVSRFGAASHRQKGVGIGAARERCGRGAFGYRPRPGWAAGNVPQGADGGATVIDGLAVFSLRIAVMLTVCKPAWV